MPNVCVFVCMRVRVDVFYTYTRASGCADVVHAMVIVRRLNVFADDFRSFGIRQISDLNEYSF